jgi:hypothetical protein
MGGGKPLRPYNRKLGTNDGHISRGIPELVSRTGVRDGAPIQPFKNPTWFSRHLEDYHKNIFARNDSDEFICRLCRCEVVIGPCRARFMTFGEVQEHVRNNHSHESAERKVYDHTCRRLSESSYVY